MKQQKGPLVATSIEALNRYPVKGLSGQVLTTVNLEPGEGFPSDRRFGFARPNSGFDPEHPKPLPKSKFYVLARDAKLALLNTEFDESNGVLTMSSASASGQFSIVTTDGKLDASQFVKSFLELPSDETPTLYEASPHKFTDVSVDSVEMMNAVSIINLESVKDFSRTTGLEIDPARFRANIHLSGLPAFSEFDMLGRFITIGTARLKIVQRTRRCPATEVDLNTGERNIKLPKLLYEKYGHRDMGVYAEVVRGGEIKVGDVAEFNAQLSDLK
ncbi:MAG: MOSC domain-containing protein [Granulosicoccus sp.]